MECHYKIAPSAPFLKEELLSLDEKNKEENKADDGCRGE